MELLPKTLLMNSLFHWQVSSLRKQNYGHNPGSHKLTSRDAINGICIRHDVAHCTIIFFYHAGCK